MSTSAPLASPADAPAVGRRPWQPPVLTELPPLVQLTLQTGGGPITGNCGPSGCTFGAVPVSTYDDRRAGRVA